METFPFWGKKVLFQDKSYLSCYRKWNRSMQQFVDSWREPKLGVTVLWNPYLASELDPHSILFRSRLLSSPLRSLPGEWFHLPPEPPSLPTTTCIRLSSLARVKIPREGPVIIHFCFLIKSSQSLSLLAKCFLPFKMWWLEPSSALSWSTQPLLGTRDDTTCLRRRRFLAAFSLVKWLQALSVPDISVSIPWYLHVRKLHVQVQHFLNGGCFLNRNMLHLIS